MLFEGICIKALCALLALSTSRRFRLQLRLQSLICPHSCSTPNPRICILPPFMATLRVHSFGYQRSCKAASQPKKHSIRKRNLPVNPSGCMRSCHLKSALCKICPLNACSTSNAVKSACCCRVARSMCCSLQSMASSGCSSTSSVSGFKQSWVTSLASLSR